MSARALGPGALVAGRYRLEEPLGEGGMGTVWAATHTVTRRSVAMKLLKESLAHRPELRQRFLREASAASSLRHPNVVEVLDVFDLEEGVPALVMELLRGQTLGQKLAHDERLSVEETADILLPVVSAVGTAHALGVVHRDLKPDNVFLATTPNGMHVKVLDFGIAKLTARRREEGGAESLHTAEGAMLGTPCYMAPEQAAGEGQIDHRADVWSLGVILYECLSGTRPIEGDNLAQVVTRLMSAGIIPLERLAPELPHELSALVMRMLCRDVGGRTASLHETAQVLGRYTRAQVPSFGPPSRSEAEEGVPHARVSSHSSADPRGPTLLSSPPAPSSVTVHRDSVTPAVKTSSQRTLVLAGVAFALLLAIVALLRTRDLDVPSSAASSAPSATTLPPAPVMAAPPSAASPEVTPSAAPAKKRAASRPRPARTTAGVAAPAPAGATRTSPDESKLFSGRK